MCSLLLTFSKHPLNKCLVATVQKIITEILPASAGQTFAKDARDLLIECCVEFITLVSSEANEISEKEAKKTIAAEHIEKALRELGFMDYIPDVLAVAEEHKEALKVGLILIRYISAWTWLMLTSVDSREAHKQDRPERPVAGGVAQHAAGAVPRRDAKVPVGLLTMVFSVALGWYLSESMALGVWGFIFSGYPGFGGVAYFTTR